ncbi:MAG: DMT family transporter [Clostridiales bacterium]|jgi:drug/metabolite transporter (DMT)-like permease|nr:DMT family transporter [Clostridiales bacterium]
MTRTENNILLFSITLCWSASYIFIKSLPPELSVFAYLTLTTGIATVILVAVFAKRLRRMTRGTVKTALVLSAFLTANLLLEKKGIERLPSSNASFLAALAVIAVPLLLLLFKRKPSRNNAVGAFVIVAGLGLTNRFSISAFMSSGTVFMLLSCMCTAAYTIAADRFTKREDPLLIGILQMGFTALSSFALWFFEDSRTFLSVDYTKELLSSIFILAFFSKAYAYIVLMFSQKYTDPVSVTIIASTEPVVTLLLAVLIPAAFGGSETFSIFSLCGAMVIVAGAVIAGSNFLGARNLPKEGHTIAR